MNWWLIWIAVFLVLIFSISVISFRKIKTSDDYVMANFNLGFMPIVGTVIATVSGSSALIGAAGKGFEMGISYFITAMSFVSFTIIFVVTIGPIIRKLKLYTVPDLFVRRFGKAAALIPALIIAFLYMTPTFSMQLVGMGSLLTSIIDISITGAIIIGFLVSVVFTMMGGMYSVAWTDAVQTVIIFAGVILMFILGLNYTGGFNVLIEETSAHYFDFFSIGWKELLNWALVFGPFYIVWQTTWQRISAAKTAKVGTWGVTVGFILSGILQIFTILIGIMAIHTLASDTMPDNVYTDFMVEIFPASIGGLFMVSLLAALLTGATSFLLSGAINISKDIYQEWVNPDAEDDKILKVSRIAVLGMAVLGLMIALYITDVIEIYQIALSFTAVTLVAPVLAIMFWKRATKTGVIASMIGSIIISTIWRFSGEPFGIHEILPGLITSFILLILVSLFTGHSDDEEVTAYYHTYKEEKGSAVIESEESKSAEI
ncbi:sodium:solute symporter [Lentibacillus sp. CBA3610]|uniref:sodium:solute symporter family protein n=1 Tax=Lentibacillus sp. CBA3610 TaxID=2518176 RepID=UPI001595B46A|nr:sodium:solute symporter family protein [Lentibacillus sp. CBA3610]QKY70126.1 sodium:solute symporter family protein [Lentibacillus sp. CBA3610]